MSRHRLLRKHLLFLLGVLGLWSLYLLAGIPCPMKAITGIPCPTCGVTRALLALLRGDWEGYLYWHPLAVPLVLAVILALHLKCAGRFRPFIWVYLLTVLGLNLVLYVCRLKLYFA